MKRFSSMLLAVSIGAVAAPVHAVDFVQSVSAGPLIGYYHQSVTATNDGNGQEATDSVNSFVYGGALGYYVLVGSFYGNLGLELLRGRLGAEILDRTDVLPTLGYYVTNNLSVFAGYRWAYQGPNFFNNDDFDERGPYVGVGYGGIPLAADWMLGTSLAYNFDTVKDFFVDDYRYHGIGIKLSANKAGSPHSFQLRAQRFSGEESTGGITLELSEIYVTTSYSYSFKF
jgi:hypothetical protein